MSNTILFEDTFDVRSLNDNGKKFERVDRLHCRGTTYDVDMVVDVNSELFSVTANNKIVVALASTLSLHGAPDDGLFNPVQGPSLADPYDYVMHGRVYSIKHLENQNIEIQASFGGLLFRLKGEQAYLANFTMDQQFFILVRKAGMHDVAM
jgi:DNA-directed RNA polymerases I, II, and III subunit RPABC3